MAKKMYSSPSEYKKANPYLLISSRTGEILERGRSRKALEAKSLKNGAVRGLEIVTETQLKKMKF